MVYTKNMLFPINGSFPKRCNKCKLILNLIFFLTTTKQATSTAYSAAKLFIQQQNSSVTMERIVSII